MLHIGTPYIQQNKEQSRLCADISMNGRGATLWFGVVPEQGKYLCVERSDAFVMALLPAAMRNGWDVCCEGPMSERLHYQLEEYLIPILSSEMEPYQPVALRAPLADGRVTNKHGVGTAFSADENARYCVMTHGADSTYPLTHLAVFRTDESDVCAFSDACHQAQAVAQKMGWEPVFLDTNLHEVLSEPVAAVASFRILACAMALQGLFSVYLHTSGLDSAHFSFDAQHSAAYDLLTVHCAQTESLTVFRSGCEVTWDKKSEKLLRKGEPEAIHAVKRTITIGAPYIREETDRVFLCAQIAAQQNTAEAWFSVEREYAPYLTDDRADAFLLGLLTTAMRVGADIVCEAPVSRKLLYSISNCLIPALSANVKVYHPITIRAQATDAVLENAGAVGTGWTGGVDCTYTLMSHIQNHHPSRRLTHLLVANNGAIESEDAFGMLECMVESARSGAVGEYGLPVVGVDCNLQVLAKQHYLMVAAFRLPAVALALQKLFGVFLNSAGPAFSYFTLETYEDSSHYELLPLSCYETDVTAFYSAGCKFNRVQKLEALSEFPLAQKNLHPCYKGPGSNCNRCFKCTHSMFALYAMGTLENFRQVFDVDWFYEHKDEILEEILLEPEQSLNSKILLEIKRRGTSIPAEVARKARLRRAALNARRNLNVKEECLN